MAPRAALLGAQRHQILSVKFCVHFVELRVRLGCLLAPSAPPTAAKPHPCSIAAT